MPYVKTNKTTRMFRIHKPSKKTFKKRKCGICLQNRNCFSGFGETSPFFKDINLPANRKLFEKYRCLKVLLLQVAVIKTAISWQQLICLWNTEGKIVTSLDFHCQSYTMISSKQVWNIFNKILLKYLHYDLDCFCLKPKSKYQFIKHIKEFQILI